jgi:TolB-like protein
VRAGTGSRDAAAVTRITELPFSNLGSPGDDVFVAGLTEEIASRLASLQQIAVPSSTTTSNYGRAGKSMREVGPISAPSTSSRDRSAGPAAVPTIRACA